MEISIDASASRLAIIRHFQNPIYNGQDWSPTEIKHQVTEANKVGNISCCSQFDIKSVMLYV